MLAPPVMISNNRQPKSGNSQNKTPLGVQPLSTYVTNQSSISSSILEAPEELPSHPTRISSLSILTNKAARARLARMAEDKRPPRFTTHANLCNEVHDVHEPNVVSSNPIGLQKPPSEDIGNPQEEPNRVKPQRHTLEPNTQRSLANNMQMKSHYQYPQAPTTHSIHNRKK
jgi:hypothetical protein